MQGRNVESKAAANMASGSGITDQPVYPYPYTSSAVLELVDPESARRYLAQAPDSSRSNAGRRQEMARMMAGGQWGFNGDTLTLQIP